MLNIYVVWTDTKYTVFFLRIWHLLFFGTLSLKCVLNLQILASSLFLRHSKPTARREKVLYFMEKNCRCRCVLVQNTWSPHLQLFKLLPQLLPNIGQANLKEVQQIPCGMMGVPKKTNMATSGLYVCIVHFYRYESYVVSSCFKKENQQTF